MINILIFISVGLTAYYVAFLYQRYFALNKAINAQSSEQPVESDLNASESEPLITVIIPARNEEENIESCIRSIVSQGMKSGLPFEIILVDDESKDNTVLKAESLGYEALRILPKPSTTEIAHKKVAISAAITQARGPYIFQTDADCIVPDNWFSSHWKELDQGADMVCGAVTLTGETFFQRLQINEFLGLIGVGAGSLLLKAPNMCNGANLSYRKEVYLKTGGHKGNMQVASGDDEFLMHSFFSKGYKVKFNLALNSAVRTPAVRTLGEFIQQRKRWVSKSGAYEDPSIKMSMVLSYLFMAFGLLMTILSPMYTECILPAALFWWIKFMMDSQMVETVAKLSGTRISSGMMLIQQPLHVVYVLIIGIIAQFGGYRWKERRTQ